MTCKELIKEAAKMYEKKKKNISFSTLIKCYYNILVIYIKYI